MLVNVSKLSDRKLFLLTFVALILKWVIHLFYSYKGWVLYTNSVIGIWYAFPAFMFIFYRWSPLSVFMGKFSKAHWLGLFLLSLSFGGVFYQLFSGIKFGEEVIVDLFMVLFSVIGTSCSWQYFVSKGLLEKPPR